MNGYVPCHGAFRDLGEAAAEFAYSELRGLGEAEAARRLPVVKDALATMARTIALLKVDANADHSVEDALRGFRTRGAELGFMGARAPTTFRESFQRRRLHEALKLLDAIPIGRATAEYLARLGVDPAIVEAKCGRLAVVPGGHPAIADMDRFDDSPQTPRVVVEVRDFDGETPVDLILWPIGRPEDWLTGFDTGTLLGHHNVETPSDEPLQVRRDPEAWLRAKCDGVVVISDAEAWRNLHRWPGYLAAEDVDHARQLSRLIAHVVDPRKIVVRDAA